MHVEQRQYIITHAHWAGINPHVYTNYDKLSLSVRWLPGEGVLLHIDS